MDKSFLEEQGTISFKVYRCPCYGNYFAYRPSGGTLECIQNISPGFISPSEVFRPKKESRKDAAMILKMTLQKQ